MATISMKNLLESGVHFGHQTRRWNPKMKPFIFTARNGIHIINLQKTITMAKTAYEAMREIAAQGGKILFVGTKKQAQEEIEKAAVKCGMYFINNRWLGGFLTNFDTVKKSIQKLKKLEDAFERNAVHELVKTKKEVLVLEGKKNKLSKYLRGIKEMNELPDAIFLIDPVKEEIAIQEARKMGIPIFAMVDTNCDPDVITYPIPANDDAIRAISLFLSIMSNAIEEGKAGGVKTLEEIEEEIDETASEELEASGEFSKIEDLEEIESKYDTSLDND
ncbi:MAG: 30S ribosomal protein S2 [Spirochaetia bacterium]|nr:30S ribosomal protein S2 [Spirochaetia bacterium]